MSEFQENLKQFGDLSVHNFAKILETGDKAREFQRQLSQQRVSEMTAQEVIDSC